MEPARDLLASGKSVLLNSIALLPGHCGRVWIIDIGRSFEKLCQTVGGQYPRIHTGIRHSTQPLLDGEAIDEDLEMLIPLFEQMISPSAPLDDYRRRQLGLHILSVW